MRKIKIAFFVAVSLILLIVALISAGLTWLRGEKKESFTFIGTVYKTSYSSLPNVPLFEVVHDGRLVVLASIEKVQSGKSPHAENTQIALIVRDYSEFGGSGFDGKKFRITLTKFR